jgi:hypothetical protein
MAKKKPKSSNPFNSLRNISGNPKYGRRQFKRDVNKLIKQGLYTPSVSLEDLQPGKYVNSLLRKFQDVLSGTAQAIKVNPGEVKKYKEQGIRTRNGRAIVEVPKGATAERIRAENGTPRYKVTQRTKQGTRTTVREIVPEQDLEARIRRLVESEGPITRNEFYGFRFFGNNSARYFKEKEMLLNYFLSYPTFQEAARSDSAEMQQDVYQNFEITRFSDVRAWGAEYNARRNERASQRSKEASRRYRERLKERYAQMDELEKREFRERRVTDRENRASRERARRAQLKHDDPSAYAKMLEENAARVRASRAAKKKK